MTFTGYITFICFKNFYDIIYIKLLEFSSDLHCLPGHLNLYLVDFKMLDFFLFFQYFIIRIRIFDSPDCTSTYLKMFLSSYPVSIYNLFKKF